MPKKTEEFIAAARKRFKLCEDAESNVRSLALEDLEFRAGEQWPEGIKVQRDLDGRPCLTINVLPSRERQVLNEQRQNRPAIHVNPVDDNGDPETAEIIQGIIRHIEYDSNADVAYDTAMASAVRIGVGYVRILTEYDSPDSFEQSIKIKRILNPFQVYFDPACTEPDYSDSEYAFITETLSKEDYLAQYPKGELAGINDWASVGDREPGWLNNDSVRIAEYFYRETTKDKLMLVRSPMGDERPILASNLPEGGLPKGFTVVAERDTDIPIVKWCKFNQVEILEEKEWPSKWIGIVPVLGDELNVNGKRVLEGMVRHTKDVVRMQNYMASALVEAIGVGKSGTWIAAEGQVEGREKEWQNPNPRLLLYKPQTVAGTLVNEPHMNTAEPPIQAITAARMQFVDDLKAVTGIYDAQLGAKSNEQSGRAILQRKIQGQVSNFHYTDNLSRLIRHVGRILIDLIPKIYSGPRVMRIIGEDGDQKTVQINQRNQKTGKIYDITVGKYDVTVTAGPSFSTKRQEAVESMLELTKAFPQLAQVAGDLLVKNMDWPGAKEFSERLKKLLPPGVLDDKDGDPEARANTLQAQLQALMSQHDMLVAQLNEAKDMLANKTLELQSKHDIAAMQESNKLAIAQLQAGLEEARLNVQMQLEQMKLMHSQAHEADMQAQQQVHEAGMQQQQMRGQADMQREQMDNQAMMAEQTMGRME